MNAKVLFDTFDADDAGRLPFSSGDATRSVDGIAFLESIIVNRALLVIGAGNQ